MGGRGITICPQWMNFINFLQDMGERPKGLTLDRKNNNGNYEPSNCKWSDQIIQTNNATSNIRVKYNGSVKTIAEWSVYLNIPYHILYKRTQHSKWSFKKAIKTPIRSRKFNKL